MPVSEEKPCFVGIDVSKKTLDICILPQQECFQVENKSFKSLCKRLKAFSPTLIVMETTGGYEQALYEALNKAGFRVSRENAVNLYHHRRSRGKRAKTDGIDAETIAHYAQCHSDSIRDKEPLDKTQDRLRQLLHRRADLVKSQTAEKNRLQAPVVDSVIVGSVKRTLTFLEKEIAKVGESIEELITQQTSFHAKKQLLTTVTGIGDTIASSFLAWLPELGIFTHKQLAALVGVAPYHHESGQYHGKRRIQGGRGAVRSALYLATLSAVRWNPLLKDFYQALLERGKPKKVALIACAHKLLRIINAMIRKQAPFETI
jgi:transposase